MTRRLRLAAFAGLTLAFPACTNMPNERAAMPYGYRPLPGVVVPNPQDAPSDQFATQRGTPPAPGAPAKAAPLAKAKPPATVPFPPANVVEDEQPKQEIERVSNPPRIDAAKLIAPTVKNDPPVEVQPDKEGVIRAPYPKLNDTPPIGESPPLKPVQVETTPPTPPLNTIGPVLAPPPITPPIAPPGDMGPTIMAPPPVIAPPTIPETLPPSIVAPPNHQTRSSPLGMAPTSPMVMGDVRPTTNTVALQDDTPLIKAIRALQENRPADATLAFRQHDAATQQLLLALLPPVMHLSEGKLPTMKPEEVDVLLEQLTRVPNMLRTRASLQVNRVQLCREVHSFAKVEAYPAKHTFRSGDMVHLYVELANFSCAPDAKGGYAVALGSSLEVRDAAGSLVWRADPKEDPDRMTSVPLDYYRAYRFSVPNLAGGTYSLAIRIVDRPTGREVRKTLDFRVLGAK